jgi:hypothetical protein
MEKILPVVFVVFIIAVVLVVWGLFALIIFGFEVYAEHEVINDEKKMSCYKKLFRA